MKRALSLSIPFTILVAAALLGLLMTPVYAGGMAQFEQQVAQIWGADNVWRPAAKQWVHYEEDLGERSLVDFETGRATIQLLLKVTDDPQSEVVRAHMQQGIGNLILREPVDPLEQIAETPAMTSEKRHEVRVYLVKKGDSLWKIARKFQMKMTDLAKLNELSPQATLFVGRPLKVRVYSSHDLSLDPAPPNLWSDPLLLDQIRMVDGRPVSRWLVKEYAVEVLQHAPPTATRVVGADGFERLVVSVSFKLVENHLEVRARKYHPLVRSYAKTHNLDPALIMAIIHTESMFNPRARSPIPAFGLMQVVPHTAGREAYHRLYGKTQRLTPGYLYDPENNIELGVAYLEILRDEYMKAINHPISRTYCAIAAYNAGLTNVGRAFILRKSLRKAAPVINTLKPDQVYAQLVKSLPFKESRDYVRKVIKRTRLYEGWH